MVYSLPTHKDNSYKAADKIPVILLLNFIVHSMV